MLIELDVGMTLELTAMRLLPQHPHWTSVHGSFKYVPSSSSIYAGCMESAGAGRPRNPTSYF